MIRSGEMEEVSIVSSEGDVRTIKREVAIISPTLKRMLQSSFVESDGKITLREFDTKVLEKVIEYLEYVYEYKDVDENEDIPEFEVSPDISLDLLLAADYLNI